MAEVNVEKEYDYVKNVGYGPEDERRYSIGMECAGRQITLVPNAVSKVRLGEGGILQFHLAHEGVLLLLKEEVSKLKKDDIVDATGEPPPPKATQLPATPAVPGTPTQPIVKPGVPEKPSIPEKPGVPILGKPPAPTQPIAKPPTISKPPAVPTKTILRPPTVPTPKATSKK